jgi:(p)ppGpp synthase/HD superfamily hydrolase
VELVRAAAHIANYAHHGQVRKYNGRPYIEHPGRVAMRLTIYGFDDHVIAAAWCHDVLEDTDVTGEHLDAVIGRKAFTLVKELTNAKYPGIKNRAERKNEQLKDLASRSYLARTIKCFDRADNLADMDGAPQDFLKLYVQESIELQQALRITSGPAYVALMKEIERLSYRLAAAGLAA